MNDIKVLDKNTIDRIAAGEVVERPANVVKELMENSIDAGANAVSVEIQGGGKTLIRITDNGCGIPESQVRTAFLRHATSKIRNADDLSFVTSLGFRGEALSSIAAVSDMELCTKTADSVTGTIYKISGGEETAFEEAGLPDGTTVIIRNLFRHVPARLKFLASNQTEGNTISDAVEKIALSHPEVAIKFTNNGATRLSTSGNGSLKDVIYAVYGREMASNLLPIDFNSELLSISGFIGKPVIARGSRAFENYFVNGRYVKDKIIASAIENAYKGYQMKGSFPFTAFNIRIEPELMDVNVHPSKLEIRFTDSEGVYNLIEQAIGDTIRQAENIPDAGTDSVAEKILKSHKSIPEPFEVSRKSTDEDSYGSVFDDPDSPAYARSISHDEWKAYSDNVACDDYFLLTNERPARQSHNGYSSVLEDEDYSYEQVFREHVPYEARKQSESWQGGAAADSSNQPCLEAEQSPTQPEPEYKQQSFFEENAFLSAEARPQHRLVGEVFDTYWIVEFRDKMFIIDQHAAHEKVLYEKFMKKIQNSELTSQMIAPGIVVRLSPSLEQCLVRIMVPLEKLGFQIDNFGGSDYIISAVPADLYGLNSEKLFLSFLDEMAENPGSFSSEMLNDRIATAACKAAVKGGNRISVDEADHLIDELMSLDNPYNCPHGRPTIISMSKTEIEKKFKRIV